MFDWFGQIEFRHPWLLAVGALAVVVYLLSRRAGGTVVFSSLRLLPRTSSSWRTRFAWAPDLLLAIAALALVVAMAGPRIPDRQSRVTREGIAIAMVVDISGSMQALDLSTEQEELTRLDAAMQVFTEFVRGGDGLRGRPDDAIGIVSFARYADTRCPPTLDHGILFDVASDLEIVTDRSEDGTALGDGLALAVQLLSDAPVDSRVAIVLTDGVNNAGVESPLAAAELAATQNVRVYTIGAGTTGVAPVRAQDPFTGRTILRAVPVEIDEVTLEEIARRTNGRYFRATDSESLRRIYEEIDDLERTEIVQERYRDYHEYYGYSLAAALILASLAWLARGTVLRRLP